MPRRKPKPEAPEEREYRISVTKVTLEGADMYVTASSPEEAVEKARRNEWSDIIYTHAALVDWEADYGSVREN